MAIYSCEQGPPQVSSRSSYSPKYNKQTRISKEGYTDFRDTLAVLATVKDGPGNAARVLALKEEGLGLSILEAEDLAVATDVQLTLYIDKY